MLGRYVRELKVLRLEDAIRKMTSLPANTFQLKQRGELREGNWADIAIFDPEKVSDPSTYSDPHHWRGYMIGSKLLRPAQVFVSSGDAPADASGPAED